MHITPELYIKCPALAVPVRMWVRLPSFYKNDCLNTRRTLKIRSASTALSSHVLDTGHNFKFSNTKILGREENTQKRKILEVINILKDKNCVNFNTDVNNLSNVYTSLISHNSGSIM